MFGGGIVVTILIASGLGITSIVYGYAAPAGIAHTFFANGQQLAITPYPSLVVGVPGQTAERGEFDQSRVHARGLPLQRAYRNVRLCAAPVA